MIANDTFVSYFNLCVYSSLRSTNTIINDLGLFWSGADGAVKGTTGQYMTGFFPVMMFGLPAGALAMYHTAKDSKKKERVREGGKVA